MRSVQVALALLGRLFPANCQSTGQRLLDDHCKLKPIVATLFSFLTSSATVLLGPLPMTSVAVAQTSTYEASVGFAAIEEGDDRIRPGLTFHFGLAPLYYSRLHLWGRDHGPIEERAYLLSGGRRFSLFDSDLLQAQVGATLMYQGVVVNYDSRQETAADERSEGDFNIGPALGIGVVWPDVDPLYLAVHWEGHLFPAGLDGGILLATGRKQVLSLTVGMTL